MTKKIVVSIVVVFVVATGGTVWWQKRSTPTPKYTGPVEEIQLATAKSGQELSGLIWIADNQSYFKDEELVVNLTQEDNGIVTLQKVASGNADMAVTTDYVFVSNVPDIKNVKILTSIDQINNAVLIMRKDSGINTPSDLKGKKIAVTFGTTTEFFLDQFLMSNNIPLNQVNITNIPLADAPMALENNTVDAISASNIYEYNALNALGSNSVEWKIQGNQDFYWVVVVNDQFLKAHPGEAERFLRALLKAEQFKKANPEKSMQIIQNKFAFPPNYLEQQWPNHNFVVSLNQSLIYTLESEVRWRIAGKFTNTTEVPNYLNYIYTDALKQVKPEAMTIIK